MDFLCPLRNPALVHSLNYPQTMFWIVTILSGNALLAWGAIGLQGLQVRTKKRRDKEQIEID